VKKSRYTEEQITFALRQAETGTPVAEVIRKMGISEQTFYRWKKVYGGLGVAEVRRLKQLEEENRKLKQLVADLSLDKSMLQDVVAKNVWSAPLPQGSHRVCENSSLKCIRPLASELRLQPGPDEIRAYRSHKTASGTTARF
jgi:putative transposase